MQLGKFLWRRLQTLGPSGTWSWNVDIPDSFQLFSGSPIHRYLPHILGVQQHLMVVKSWQKSRKVTLIEDLHLTPTTSTIIYINVYIYIIYCFNRQFPMNWVFPQDPPVIALGKKTGKTQVLMGGLSYGHMLTHLDLSVLTQSAFVGLGADRRR